MSELKPNSSISVEIVSGVEGLCLLVNDYRVAGPKPWGGGTVTQSFKTKLADIERAIYGNRRAQPENEPLTLEELREIVGPVWICYPQETWGPQHPDEDSLSCSRYKFGFDDYGKTWLAYRHKKGAVNARF